MDVKWIVFGSLVLVWALIFFSPANSSSSVDVPILDNLPEPDTKTFLVESFKINAVTLFLIGDPEIDEIFYKKDLSEFEDDRLKLTSGKVILGSKKTLKNLQIDTVMLRLKGTFRSENIEINLVNGSLDGKLVTKNLKIDGTNVSFTDFEIVGAQNFVINSITIGGSVLIAPEIKTTININATRGTLEIQIPKGKREFLEVSGSNYKIKEI